MEMELIEVVNNLAEVVSNLVVAVTQLQNTQVILVDEVKGRWSEGWMVLLAAISGAVIALVGSILIEWIRHRRKIHEKYMLEARDKCILFAQLCLELSVIGRNVQEIYAVSNVKINENELNYYFNRFRNTRDKLFNLSVIISILCPDNIYCITNEVIIKIFDINITEYFSDVNNIGSDLEDDLNEIYNDFRKEITKYFSKYIPCHIQPITELNKTGSTIIKEDNIKEKKNES